MKNKSKKALLLVLLAIALSSCKANKSITLSGEAYENYLKDKEKIERIESLEEAIKENYLYEVDEKNLEEGVYKGLFQSLGDPYSEYYSKSEFKKLREQTSGEFGGIGVTVTAEKEDFITVVAPIKGTPGDRAGIKAGDKIIEINGERYTGEELSKAVENMRGEPGKEVKIVVRRYSDDKNYEDIDMTIIREIIKVESVHKGMIDDKLAYLRISSFDEKTDEDFKKALIDLEDQGAKGLVIDLRNNPGGLLNSVVNIADYLLPKGVIVSTEDKKGTKDVQESDAKMDEIPLVVLVNKGSASASEILSGAIKDYQRGEIIGTKTFGKGIVQRIFNFGEEGFKLTVSEYKTPKDVKIHKVGVEPDIVIELDENSEGIGLEHKDTDNQLQKAIEVLGEKVK